MTTNEMKKEQAINYLKQLNIYTPYINAFEKENKVCFFERFGGYWVEENSALYEKIKEIEQKYKCTVYAITHEYTIFGECFSFLLVTNYKREWKTLVTSNGNNHIAFAYVWNKTDDYCSEFGSVEVKSFGGGITRIA